jgi:hypothetical protein
MSAADARGYARRRAPRVVGPFTARWLGAVTVPLVIHDLSTGGCMILSSTKTIPANRMTLEIDLPDRSSVTVTAESLGLRSRGFAMRFVDVQPATHARLLQSIEGLLQGR